MSVICTVCDKSFSKNSNLVRHNARIHSTESRKSKPPSSHSFICAYCDQIFSRKENLKRHISLAHASSTNKRKIVCFYCVSNGISITFVTRKLLLAHCVKVHNIEIKKEIKTFPSKSEFKKWQLDVQRSTKCRFVSTRGLCKVANGVKKFYLNCFRDGYFKTTSKFVKKIKSQGSNKINATCTAQMVVSENPDSSYDVHYTSTHCDHSCNIGRLSLTKEERASIAGKVKEGVPFDTILDQIRDSINDMYEDNALVCLEKRDIWNIRRDFQLHKGRQHINDFISVKLWVEKVQDLNEKNPVLYYKEQGQDKIEFSANQLQEDSNVMLVIANDFQLSMLEKFGSNIVCIDSTHGTNMYDFHLTTLLVVDEFGNGIPTAFCISNKKDTSTWIMFFEQLRDRGILLQPKVFMSDIDDSFYNAWITVMKSAEKRLLCTWHVDKAWRSNLQEKIKIQEKRSLVYKGLRVLLQETNVHKFVKLVEGFLVDTYSDDDTKEFASYFENFYLRRSSEWAYCYRKASFINTNMYLESFHKVFKYHFLEGRKNKRLDSCIDALLRLIRDHYFKRARKLCKNKPSKIMEAILLSHRKVMDGIVTNMTQESDRIWFITSFTNPNITYEVVKILDEDEACTDGDNCYSTCIPCKICIHTYSCECVDYIIKNNICKHIHFCIQKRMKPDFVIANNASELNIDNIAMLEPYIAPVNHLPSNDILSIIKLKTEAFLGYLSKGTHVDADFGDDKLRSWTRKLDKMLEDIASVEQCSKQFISPEAAMEPTIKKIKKQVRFYSTKKNRRPLTTLNMSLPTSNEKINIVQGLLHASEGIENIHTNFDHKY